MAENLIKLIIQAVDKASGEVKKVTGSLKEGETSSQSFGVISKSAMTIAGVAIGTVVAAAYTLKKALETAAEGAEMIQIAESFDRLTASASLAPDILNQLMVAMKGTVDDEELMTATTKLLAGTTGELTTQLGNATPTLAEMAKAANKLNPAMGTTIEQYNALIQGIRAGSDRMLRQTGILVDFTKGQEAYAKSIGKTKEELSEEEKVVANLNTVLDQHDTLIGQVGGSTVSAEDNFKRLNVALGEMSDNVKIAVEPAMSKLAGALADMIEQTLALQDAVHGLAGRVAEGTTNWEDYSAQIRTSYEALGYHVSVGQESIRVFQGQGKASVDVTDKLGIMTRQIFEAGENVQGMDGYMANLNRTYADTGDTISRVTSDAVISTEEWTASYIRLIKAQYELQKTNAKKAIEEAAAAAKEAARQFDVMQKSMSEVISISISGQLTKGTAEYRNELTALEAESNKAYRAILDLSKAGTATADDWAAYVAYNEAANAKMKELRQTIEDTTKAQIYQQASQGLSADASLELAKNMGMINEQDYAVAASIMNLRYQFDANRDGMIAASEGAMKYADAITEIYNRVRQLQETGVEISFANLGTTPGGASSQLATAGASATSTAAYSYQVNVTYAPVLSMADQFELEQALTPVIQNVIRKTPR